MNHMMPNISNIEDLLTCVKTSMSIMSIEFALSQPHFFVTLGTIIVWLYDGTSWSFIVLAHNEQIIEHFRVNFFKGV
jgi:hypothetical protein